MANTGRLAPPPTEDWFNPRRLYQEGFPAGLTSALQVFEPLRTRLKKLVASLEPGFALEVGPGDRPILDPGPGTCYLDVSNHLLRQLNGARVEGDLVHAPFPDDMFDLVVAADVFSHVRPGERLAALRELTRLAPSAILFNPEPGNEPFRSAPVSSEDLTNLLRSLGCEVSGWPVQMPAGDLGVFRFGLLLATRE